MTRLSITLAAAALFAIGACGKVISEEPSDGAPVGVGLSIDGLAPISGSTEGGAIVTVRGSGFNGDNTTVVLDGAVIADIEVITEDTLVFRTPPYEVGPVGVTIFNSNGQVTFPDAFEYQPPLELQDINPYFGVSAGGTEVTVKGQSFEVVGVNGLRVELAGEEIEHTVVDDSTLTFTTPASVNGDIASLRITNLHGSLERDEAFLYLAPGLLVGSSQRAATGLYHVDPETAVVTLLTETEQFATSLVTLPDGRIYAAGRELGQAGNGQYRIGELNLITGELSDTFFSPVDLPGLTHSPTGDLVAVSRRERTSVLIDIANKTVFAGPHSTAFTPRGNGIVTDSNDQLIFFAQNGSLDMKAFRLEQNGEVTEVAVLGQAERMMGATFLNGDVYGVARGVVDVGGTPPGGGSNQSGTLVEIDVENQAIEVVGTLPAGVDSITSLPF